MKKHLIIFLMVLCVGLGIKHSVIASEVRTTAETVATGLAGTGVYWTLDSNGILTISGKGSLTSTKGYAAYQEQMRGLVIKEGITTICANAFREYVLMSGDLVIPNSVRTIGESVFYGCTGLDGTLTLSNSLTHVGNFAFCYCENLKGDLYLPDSLTYIGNCAFSDCGFDGKDVIAIRRYLAGGYGVELI